MTMLFLIRHAPVNVDFDTPSTTWHISEEGIALAERLAQLPVFHELAAVFTSPEPKAIATGQPLAARFAVPLVEHPGLAELYRGQHNIAGREAYEQAVRAAFESPRMSINGWEKAAVAQRRMIDAVRQLTAQHTSPIAIVSHGLVLSLLLGYLQSHTTVDFAAWRAIPLPALAVVDAATWQVLVPFKGVEEWQQRDV